ncbi:MAG TPA: amidohydrolase, partial [Blastocatellia bacterium]
MKRIALCILALSFAWGIALSTRAQESKTLDDFKREAVVEVDKLGKLIQEMVDSVFSFAELGFQEYETSKYVTGILEKNGFKVERGVAGIPTAWVASYGSGKPVIGFITDIDCIPRASQKPGVAYHDPIIKDAPGHGEGH